MRRLLITCLLAIPAVASAQAAPEAPAPEAPAPETPAPETPAPTPEPPKVAQETPPAATTPTEDASATATTETPTPAPAVEVHGFTSIAFSHNFNKTPDHSNPLRTFDTNSDTASIDVVELAVMRGVSKADDLGFRVDAVAGSTIPRVEAASGLFRDPATGQAGYFDLQQAYASYKPADAVTIDLGKFVTPIGYELIEGWDGWNDHYSHSYLFGYAIPFTHTGARVAYTSGDLTYTAYVVNGWDNATTTNIGKTAGLNVLYVHGPATIAATYMGGKESDGWRHIVDAVATIKLGDNATIGANGDFGQGGAMSSQWYGGALYATYSPAAKVTLALRGEVFDDKDGARTGTAQTLEEGTATVQVHLSDDAHVRAEVRVDNSDQMVFGGNDPSKTQVTAAVNALAKF
ncbi:MAG TPA: outer membrane beta-barrel protein [Kofleriaceae bacterium]|nr:outer membrane beta-barrel protein [Kofleriaceae bacterium]